VKIVKVPGPMRLLCGSLLAYWLASIANPAFAAIAVMIVLFIPLFLNDYSAMEYQADPAFQPNQKPVKPANRQLKTQNRPSSIQLLKDESEAAESS
jgi:hypothetical protein